MKITRQIEHKPSNVNQKAARSERNQQFNVEFSPPATGRPLVFWAPGLTADRVVELWPDGGEQPYEQIGRAKRYGFGVVKKYVIYDRSKPYIRAVVLLGDIAEKEGEKTQPIVSRRLEWDGPQGKTEIKRALGLLDEIARIERRGRPRGTGHPKRRFLSDLPIDAKHVEHLRKAGLNDKDLRVFFGRYRRETFKKIGKDLGVSQQAAWKRWKAT
jgi:hypothetical protein